MGSDRSDCVAATNPTSHEGTDVTHPSPVELGVSRRPIEGKPGMESGAECCKQRRVEPVKHALLLTLLTLFLGIASVQAQEWATKMFKTTRHDFGSVARGAKTTFGFELQNVYEEDVHIVSARSSCGCTSPSITKPRLKTWEKTTILAELNTEAYLGNKGATITVVFDEPFYAEVQLTVEAYIRSDVVFEPGEVNFGEIDQFSQAERRVAINYAGRENWRIVDVTSANRSFEVELSEGVRGSGRVTYDMLVRLKPDAPAGYFQDQLTIVTDDAKLERVRITAQGRVVSPISVSPASLFLGDLRPGQVVTKQLVIRSKRPCQVTAVRCQHDGFAFKMPAEQKKSLHFVPVTFTAPDRDGPVSAQIQIDTDLGTLAVCLATATVHAVPSSFHRSATPATN
jgi:hypothetical protein